MCLNPCLRHRLREPKRAVGSHRLGRPRVFALGHSVARRERPRVDPKVLIVQVARRGAVFPAPLEIASGRVVVVPWACWNE